MNTATAERVEHSVIDASQHFPAPAVRANTGVSLLNEVAMAALYRVAEIMAAGRATIPRHLQGNVADCMAIVLQAQRWAMDPFVVAKKTYVVDGNLGYEAQLVAAVINTSSLLNGRLHYEWFGPWEKIVGRFKQVESRKKTDDNGNPKKYMVPDWGPADEKGLGVRVTGLLRGESEPRVLEILMAQARTRNSTLWAEDPKQQIAYLATNRWGRLYTSELILGVYTPDELAQSTTFMGNADVVAPQIPETLLTAARAAADKGRDAFAAYWKNLQPSERRALQSEVDDFAKRTAEADKHRTFDNPAEQPGATQAPAAAVAPAAAAAPAATEATVKTTRPRPPAPAPKPEAAPAAAAPANTGAPARTAEKVQQRLKDASDLDALYIAADLINHVTDQGAIAALEALFEERKASFE